MSSSIWTRCGGRSNAGSYRRDAWRVVEAQHIVSTMKLVDTTAEQAELEALIEGHKPPLADEVKPLHYLLATPFRYPPTRHGSRFRRRGDPGVWYGAETLATGFAEVAYYRMLFLEGTTAELEPITVELSAFAVLLKSARAIDLTRPPFLRHRARFASRTQYEEPQRLAAAMRDDGVELARYSSCRDRAWGECVAVFSPRAFASPPKQPFRSFLCTATRERVEMVRKNFSRERETHSFPRAQFLVQGKLPSPAC